MNRSLKMGLAAAFLAATTLLAGCGASPLTTEATQNSDISYNVMFNRHGCEIGRFYDYNRPVYVTICPNGGTSAAQSSYTESCGKNCSTTIDTYQTQTNGNLPAQNYSVPRQ